MSFSCGLGSLLFGNEFFFIDINFLRERPHASLVEHVPVLGFNSCHLQLHNLECQAASLGRIFAKRCWQWEKTLDQTGQWLDLQYGRFVRSCASVMFRLWARERNSCPHCLLGDVASEITTNQMLQCAYHVKKTQVCHQVLIYRELLPILVFRQAALYDRHIAVLMDI